MLPGFALELPLCCPPPVPPPLLDGGWGWDVLPPEDEPLSPEEELPEELCEELLEELGSELEDKDEDEDEDEDISNVSVVLQAESVNATHKNKEAQQRRFHIFTHPLSMRNCK